jgi:hypothetical protein
LLATKPRLRIVGDGRPLRVRLKGHWEGEGPQWTAVLGLALVMPLIVEADKLLQRIRAREWEAR